MTPRTGPHSVHAQTLAASSNPGLHTNIPCTYSYAIWLSFRLLVRYQSMLTSVLHSLLEEVAELLSLFIDFLREAGCKHQHPALRNSTLD